MKRPQVKIRKRTNKVTGKTVYIVGDLHRLYTEHRTLRAARRSARWLYQDQAYREKNWGELEDVE